VAVLAGVELVGGVLALALTEGALTEGALVGEDLAKMDLDQAGLVLRTVVPTLEGFTRLFLMVGVLMQFHMEELLNSAIIGQFVIKLIKAAKSVH